MTRDARAALILLAPTLLGGAWLVLQGAGGALRPPRRYSTPPTATFGEAIAAGGPEQAYAFIRSGADPNAAIAVDLQERTAGRELSLRPLVVAAATGQENTAMMLIEFGGRVDERVRCTAARSGFDELAAMLARYSTEPAGDCSAFPPTDPPLLTFAERPAEDLK